MRKIKNIVNILSLRIIELLLIVIFVILDVEMYPAVVFIMIYMTLFDRMKESISREYKKLYKENFVVKILNEKFDDVKYDYERGFKDRYVREFGISKMGNRYKSEDYLKASYKGIEFEQADVTIENEFEYATTIYFKGRMFVFDFPYKKVSNVQIFTKFFPYKGTPMGDFIMKNVEMESGQFNKTFDIKAANEIEAFYVLTPHMMENLERLKQKYNHVALNFQDNKLFLGIWTLKDTFDGNPNRKINYLSEKENVFNEVAVITDIIDALYMMNDENANTDSEH